MSITYPIEITIKATGNVAPYGIGEIVSAVVAADDEEAAEVVREAANDGHTAWRDGGNRLSLDQDGSLVEWDR